MDKIKIALLGCGAVSDLYLPIFKHIPEIELVAVADINRESADSSFCLFTFVTHAFLTRWRWSLFLLKFR